LLISASLVFITACMLHHWIILREYKWKMQKEAENIVLQVRMMIYDLQVHVLKSYMY